jgi:hypothetical protein
MLSEDQLRAAMMRGEKSVEGTGELRRCIRNLMVHSSLPAAWETYSLHEIGDSVAAALVATLDAVAVAVSLRTRPEEPPTEATSSRAADTGFPEVTAIARHAIRAELRWEARGQTWTVPDPLGGASINLASVPVGIEGDESAGQAPLGLQRRPAQQDERWFVSLVENLADLIGVAS